MTQFIPFGDNPSDQAVLLLAAAEQLDQPVEVVQTNSDGFLVPDDVAEASGVHTVNDEPAEADGDDEDNDEGDDKPKATRKRRTSRSDS